VSWKAETRAGTYRFEEHFRNRKEVAITAGLYEQLEEEISTSLIIKTSSNYFRTW
jgi:hypothetical protein